MMRTRFLPVLVVAVWATPPLQGDVTIRSRNSIRFGAVLPGPVAQRTRNGTESPVPDSTVRYRKGAREYLKSGTFACLMDFDPQTITILDDEHKRFATVAMKEYAGKLAAAFPTLPPEYRMAQAGAKVSLTSRKTGRHEAMQGVEAEETEMTGSVALPVPAPNGEMHSEPLIQLTLQVWLAQPAVRELTGHTWPGAGFSLSIDPANTLGSAFGSMPGLGDALSRMLQEVEKTGALVLKSHLEASLPGMASFLQQMRREQGQALPDAVDVNAPFSVVDTEVVELSTSPVDDRIFQLPADYHAAPFEEVVKSVMPGYPRS